VGHVACKGESRCSAEWWFANLKERDHLEGKGVDGRVMLKWIWRRWHVWMWAEFIWFGACVDVGWIHMVWGMCGYGL